MGSIGYEIYATFDTSFDTYRVTVAGERSDDGHWSDEEITYAVIAGDGGCVDTAEIQVPLSVGAKQQILAEMRAEVQSAWARLLIAVTRGPNSSDPSDEAD